ncbi:ficolin-2-like [Anopheles darlingi]|uniref:ficolin-2-like n=1 Tax=Anopheles darlingi TaxID=43151 RepID=UPI0021003C51|nr:ficolin-2-like [Anopheles darlingi]
MSQHFLALLLIALALNGGLTIGQECRNCEKKIDALSGVVNGLVKSVENLRWLSQLNGEIIAQLSFNGKLVGQNLSAVQQDLRQLLAGQLSIISDQKLVLESLTNTSRETKYTSCVDLRSQPSGIYEIRPENPFKEPYKVLCDQDYESGGWLVIQHRYEGSTNFYRNWKQYKNGFGNLDGEFWLGLDRIHELTTSKPHELVVLLEDYDGNKTYAKYDLFEIGGESQLYELTNITGYTGSAGDSLSGEKGMKFSTLDSDNDSWSGNCAVTYTGAWWYGSCHRSNLNGKYLQGETHEYATGMVWYSFRGYHYSLKSAKMMIRPRA